MRGHIRKRGNKWAVVIDTGRDAAGKRRQKWHSGYRTKREAEDGLTDLLGRVQAGTYVDVSRMMLGEFLNERWLPAIRSGLAASTYDSYGRNVRLHIAPALGSIPIQSLTAADVTAFYGERLKAGRLTTGHEGGALSARTVRYMHAILHRALADALRWGLVLRNVADTAEPPSARSAKAPPPKTWTADELRDFLASVRSDRLYALWLVYATTGLRRGEGLALRWTDIDLDRGRIAIRAAVVSVGNAVHESTPKSARGKRSVALDEATVAALRSHRKRQLEERVALGDAYEDDDLVFARQDGKPLHPERATRGFASRVRACGARTIRLHDLRHTWASLALQVGVNPKVVSERLGHATVGFTLDVYSHVMPGLQADAAETVARLIV